MEKSNKKYDAFLIFLWIAFIIGIILFCINAVYSGIITTEKVEKCQHYGFEYITYNENVEEGYFECYRYIPNEEHLMEKQTIRIKE